VLGALHQTSDLRQGAVNPCLRFRRACVLPPKPLRLWPYGFEHAGSVQPSRRAQHAAVAVVLSQHAHDTIAPTGQPDFGIAHPSEEGARERLQPFTCGPNYLTTSNKNQARNFTRRLHRRAWSSSLSWCSVTKATGWASGLTASMVLTACLASTASGWAIPAWSSACPCPACLVSDLPSVLLLCCGSLHVLHADWKAR
jgi:hypothetical protein